MSFCLVTGGAGFIGSNVTKRLLENGHTVRILDNLSTGHRSNMDPFAQDVEFVEGDICDFATVQKAMSGCERVYHFAARASVPRSVAFPAQANEANVTGTMNLLIAARDAGAQRFVYSASSSAYGDTPTLPKIENMTPNPQSPYAVSKLAAEYYCTVFAGVYELQTISLRYFNVFGPGQDPKSDYAAAIPAFVSRMIKGERPIIYGDGEQSRDFCYIENVIDANIKAGDAAKVSGEVVNIACAERVTLNEIIRMINENLGTDIQPDYQAPRPGDVRHSLADISAAERVIGYRPKVMFAEGLRRAIDYYKSIA